MLSIIVYSDKKYKRNFVFQFRYYSIRENFVGYVRILQATFKLKVFRHILHCYTHKKFKYYISFTSFKHNNFLVIVVEQTARKKLYTLQALLYIILNQTILLVLHMT